MFFRLSHLLKGFLEGFGIKFIGRFVAECSYLNIQQITVVIALFFKMIVKSAVYDSRGTISESFGFFWSSSFYDKFWGGTNKSVIFWPKISAEYQNCIPRNQDEILRISNFFEKNYNFIIIIETWGEIFCLGGRNCKLPVQTMFWGELMTLKKLFVAK